MPVEANSHQRHYWAERDECENHARVIGGPAEGPEVIPCPALIAPGANVVHVAYRLDEIEVAALARGGTLWLTTWGGLPIHLVEVVGPDESPHSARTATPDDGAEGTHTDGSAA